MAEVLQETHVPPRDLFLVAAVDVIGSQFDVGGAAGQQMPDDLQDGARHGDEGDLVPAVPADPAVARPEGGALDPDGGEGRLNQGDLQPSVPLAGAAPPA